MKTIIRLLIVAMATVFNQPVKTTKAWDSMGVLMANSDPAIAPMSGGTFDFQKMVLSLLGLNEGANEATIQEAYKSAIDCKCDDPTFATALEKAAVSNKANEKLVSDLAAAKNELQAANEKISAATAPKEVEIKILDKTVKVFANEAELEGINLFATEANAAITAANERVTAAETKLTTAEANFVNERQSRRQLVLAALVTGGQLTLAESKLEDENLSKPQFANAQAFDARVTELGKLPSKLGVKSTVFSMLSTLGETVNTQGQAKTASQEFANEVAREQTESSLSYEDAWAKVKASPKGKALMATMAAK